MSPGAYGRHHIIAVMPVVVLQNKARLIPAGDSPSPGINKKYPLMEKVKKIKKRKKGVIL